jgi:hypothetical protein
MHARNIARQRNDRGTQVVHAHPTTSADEAGGEDRRRHGGETEEDGRSLAIGTGREMAMKGFNFLLAHSCAKWFGNWHGGM